MSHSSLSHRSNPFASSSEAGSLPNPAYIRDVPIFDRVPIKLSHTEANFYAWKTYFKLLFREYNLRDHIDGTTDFLTMRRDEDWMAVDATIIRWLFLTVSKDIFHTVVRDGDDAYTVWTKIVGLFTDNKLQRIVFLQQEFFGCHQNDSSIDAYCMRLKTLSDELNDVGFKVGDELLLSTLTAGLNEDLGNAASNLTLMANPTYERAVAYLRLEERRLKNLRARAVHTAFAAGYSHGGSTSTPPARGHDASLPPQPRPPVPPAAAGAGGYGTPYGASYGSHPPRPLAPVPPPQQQQQHQGDRRGRGGRRGRGNRSNNGGGQQRGGGQQQHLPLPPWGTGHNPWTGVVHAYTMPVPRAPLPGLLGPRPAAHQAFYAAPQPGAPTPPPPPTLHSLAMAHQIPVGG